VLPIDADAAEHTPRTSPPDGRGLTETIDEAIMAS
jgi:hypothetical protein